MNIQIATTAGFCMGVRRAVEMVLDAPGKHEGPIFTFGPLIHNPQVLNLLKEKGITVLETIPEKGEGTVLIRAHGVPPEVKTGLELAGFKVIDATCPRVIKVQTIINKHARLGYDSIIAGDRDHPEVIGLLGYAEDRGYIVGNIIDLEALPEFEQAIMVAQTTQNTDFYEKAKEFVRNNRPHYKIFDTICDSTEKRQHEVRKISESVDVVIVVGGFNSGNTRRLAEIAKDTGKPAFHIESESDLNISDLPTVANIGITAGASTPHWIIRKVYRSLEVLLSNRKSGWRKTIFNIQRTLLLTNIYLSLGAGCLCYASTRLQGIDSFLSNALISMLYVQSMHMLNNLVGRKEDRYNDPDRSLFYDTHMRFLTLLAVIAGGIGLATAFAMGIVPFSILLVMSAMGLSYNLRILPAGLSGGRFRRLKDIPGSKTVLIALAWGVVTSLLPPLFVWKTINLKTILVFVWATGMVFVRTVFFDILAMQGDRIMGKETLPLLLGEKRALTLLKVLLAVVFTILFLSSTLGFPSSLGIALAICPIFMSIILLAHERGKMHPSVRLEFLVETHFVLAGVITFIWSALH